MKLLVLEDDRRLGELIVRALRMDGHAADLAATVAEACWLLDEFDYDAAAFDVVLPDGDGFSLCETMRTNEDWTPVMMLTARDAVADRVRGLDVGADDYLVKPFAREELLARLRAIARRGHRPRPVDLRVGDLRVDLVRREAWVADRRLELTAREFGVLELFARHPDEVLTRQRIIDEGWDFAFEGTPRNVDVHVGHLRRSLGAMPTTPRLESVRSVGYVLRSPGGHSPDRVPRG